MFAWMLTIIALLIIAFSLLAQQLQRFNISAAMAFIVAGCVVFSLHSERNFGGADVRLIAELCLMVILFHDASTVHWKNLWHDPSLPMRLLLVAMPITLLLLFALSYVLFPMLGLAGALLVAAALTPTDAGLGAATVLDLRVPLRIRQALNVESGINDGLVTPVVLFALAFLVNEEGADTPTILQVGVVPVLSSVCISVLLTPALAWCIDQSTKHQLCSERGCAIALLTMPFALWGVSSLTGANAFITGFLSGLLFGAFSRQLHARAAVADLLETGADLLSYLVWFLAGGLVFSVFSVGFDWMWLLIAICALTVCRIVPVVFAFMGSGLRLPSALFVGWFGPRGLATIVFALMAVEELGLSHVMVGDIVGILLTTVVLSVFAHGMSAAPFALRYSRWTKCNLDQSTRPIMHFNAGQKSGAHAAKSHVLTRVRSSFIKLKD